jgi:ubiquinone biosynthesis protein UbiJ
LPGVDGDHFTQDGNLVVIGQLGDMFEGPAWEGVNKIAAHVPMSQQVYDELVGTAGGGVSAMPPMFTDLDDVEDEVVVLRRRIAKLEKKVGRMTRKRKGKK